MSCKIPEENYESKARASPRGEVCRKPATCLPAGRPRGEARNTKGIAGSRPADERAPHTEIRCTRGWGKCRACAVTTHVLIRGDLFRVLGRGVPRKLTAGRSNPL